MIIFAKNKIIYDNDINPEHEDHVRREIDSFIPHLADIVEFEEDFTIKDFFDILAKEEELVQLVFGSHMGHYPLKPFLDDIEKEYTSDEWSKLDYVEISWVVNQDDYALYYEKNKDKNDFVLPGLKTEMMEPSEDDMNEISIYLDVCAWGDHKPLEGEKDPPEKSSYAIEFSPLSELSDLSIKLNENINIYPVNCWNVDSKPVVKGVRRMTVYDAVGALLSELTFCGYPEDRDAQLEDIKVIAERVKNGEEELHEMNFDDIIKEIENDKI
jgi:hypothetical protein